MKIVIGKSIFHYSLADITLLCINFACSGIRQIIMGGHMSFATTNHVNDHVLVWFFLDLDVHDFDTENILNRTWLQERCLALNIWFPLP